MNSRFAFPILSAALFVTFCAACDKDHPSIVVLPTPAVSATTNVSQPHPTTPGEQVVDRQALAAYQATLSAYAEPIADAKRMNAGQIADRQALAAYQATLTLGDVGSNVTK